MVLRDRHSWIVLAAFALASCDSSSITGHDWDKDEIPPSTYNDIATSDMDSTERAMVKSFMADGKIDYGELKQLNDYEAKERDKSVNIEAVKTKLRNG